MKLLYGTTNQAKLDYMKHITRDLNFEIIGLNDLTVPIPTVDECGENPLENAALKAKAYYDAFQIPVFSCDSGLYFDDIPEEIQPGTHVRRVYGRELSDEEMITYYGALAKQNHNQLTARYKNAICLIFDAEHTFQSMGEALMSEPFLIVDKPHPKRVKGFPLDSLSVDMDSRKYYYDLTEEKGENVAIAEGLCAFFMEALEQMNTKIKEKIVDVKDYLTKSNLPASDFVINPYVGCPHGCKYCYASFMKRFTGHKEPWGSFIDIKQCQKPISIKRITGKSVFLSSVTDCYNKYEEYYGITRKLLEQLADVDCELGISTKSKLILRDIELLKRCKNLKVSMSVNTLDEKFKNDMDHASSIEDRLNTLKTLHEQGIFTVLFMSPIFPEITDFRAIIEKSRDYIDEYWFENLNLRGTYKQTILEYVEKEYPKLHDLYREIYEKGNKEYWVNLSIQMEHYCRDNHISHINYFYHEALVKAKSRSNNKGVNA